MIKVEESKIQALKSHPGYMYAKTDLLNAFTHYKEMNEMHELSNAHLNKTLFWMSVENYLKENGEPWKLQESERKALAEKAYSDASGKYITMRGEELSEREKEVKDSENKLEEYDAIRRELIEEEENFAEEPFDL